MIDQLLELIQETDQKNQLAMHYIDNGEPQKAMQTLALNYDLLGTIHDLLREIQKTERSYY